MSKCYNRRDNHSYNHPYNKPSYILCLNCLAKDPPLARLRACGQLVDPDAVDLCFTAEEAARFLTEVMDAPLSSEDVATLEERIKGWSSGLQKAALSLRDQPHEQGTALIDAFTRSHHVVVDFLIEEVLARLPAHIRNFLLYMFILDRLFGPLCDRCWVT